RNIEFELLHSVCYPQLRLVSRLRPLLQLRQPLLLLVQTTLPSLRRGTLVVAPNRCLQVRNPGMVQFNESGVVRFEPVVQTEVGLHCLSGMMSSEDFGR